MILTLPSLPLMLMVLIGAVIALAVLLSLYGLLRRRALLWRGLAGLALGLALLNPLLNHEERQPIRDVAVMVVDQSDSQRLGERAQQMAQAEQALREKFAALKTIDLRVVHARQAAEGTKLFSALDEALKDIAPERLAGVVMLSDGQVHDVPASDAAGVGAGGLGAAGLGLGAPLHVLISGHEGEFDRRLEIVEAPKFGIVGKEAELRLRVVDSSLGKNTLGKDGQEKGAQAGRGAMGRVHVQHDGVDLVDMDAAPGEEVRVRIPLDHAGPNIVDLALEPVPGEMTLLNNRQVVSIEGVRDRVRVLLVSGTPNPGERAWRNVLKSDPNIDLVHYTILRFPSRIDPTPINELALIGFPIDQLFSRDIDKFDLIIFDRYANKAPLPDVYFQSIGTYLRKGGAVLVSAGPDYADEDGLGRSPINEFMPAVPTGEVVVKPFVPKLSALGEAHPVTRGLKDAAPDWANFYRQIGARATRGEVVLEGADAQPLLVLSREDKGRVALFLSDQLWLWARGVNGGGPQLELLRRMTHWLLKEPQLEEEALRARQKGDMLEIERQSLGPQDAPVQVTAPDGSVQDVTLQAAWPGLFIGRVAVGSPGLYRLVQGTLHAFAAVGLVHSREFDDVVSTPEILRGVAEASGGSVQRLDHAGQLKVPDLALMAPTRHYGSGGVIGLRRNGLSSLTGLSSQPLVSGAGGLLALAGLLLVLWLWEGFGAALWRR